MGQKWESASYQSIVTHINCQPNEILFLTDVEREAQAASEAGLSAVLVVREGNAPLSKTAKNTFRVVITFAELLPGKD
jgi:enolase-phosphatase E1